MLVWIDAQLSPAIATWLAERFGVQALPLRDLGLRDSEDSAIFFAARSAGAVVMTKDADFVALLGRHGAPPPIAWVTCGNTSNRALREVLAATWPRAITLLAAGEPLVEISGRP